MLLVLIGAPTLGQAWAVILLPITDYCPLLASAAVWFATVAVLRVIVVVSPKPGL